MFIRSRCFPLLKNTTFNGIVLGHKTAAAVCNRAALPFYCHVRVSVFAGAAPIPGIFGPETNFQRGSVPKLCVKGGGLGTSFSRACVNGIWLEVRRQGNKALLFPRKLSTQSRLGFYELVSQKVGATFPCRTCVCWGVQEQERLGLVSAPRPDYMSSSWCPCRLLSSPRSFIQVFFAFKNIKPRQKAGFHLCLQCESFFHLCYFPRNLWTIYS